jgi:arylsulfatase A-like enzyme
MPSWTGIRTDRYKFVEWEDGFTELYDLGRDPIELRNIAPDSPGAVAALADLLGQLEDCVGAECFYLGP